LDPIVPLVDFGYLSFNMPVIVLLRYRIIPFLMLLLLASYAIDSLLEYRRQRLQAIAL
jgi:hypothetical protein